MISGHKGAAVPGWITYTIDYILLETGLTRSDVVAGGEIVDIGDLEGYYKDQQAHANRTQIGLLFCGG